MAVTQLEIIYSDEHFVAVNKPGGLMMHPSNLERQAAAYLIHTLRDQLQQWVYLIHRLDRPTSGVVMCALEGSSPGGDPSIPR